VSENDGKKEKFIYGKALIMQRKLSDNSAASKS
jgi:hypothetical protein